MMLESPVDVFDMDIEAPTPSENYIPIDTSENLIDVLGIPEAMPAVRVSSMANVTGRCGPFVNNSC